MRIDPIVFYVNLLLIVWAGFAFGIDGVIIAAAIMFLLRQ